jgi:hypothetical protein
MKRGQEIMIAPLPTLSYLCFHRELHVHDGQQQPQRADYQSRDIHLALSEELGKWQFSSTGP